MDAVGERVQVAGVRVEDAENRSKWKTAVGCGDAGEGTRREEGKILSGLGKDSTVSHDSA